jgi:hypothetical protein
MACASPAPPGRSRRDEALEMVRLPAYADRKPGELSGGQRQRVALVNVVAVLVILISIVPAYLAHRLTREEGGAAGGRAGGGEVAAEATAVP